MDMDFWYELIINDLEHLIDVAELGGTKNSMLWEQHVVAKYEPRGYSLVVPAPST